MSAPQAPFLSPGEKSPGFLVRLYERFAHLVREVGKFGVVGAVCYVIDISIFNIWNALTDQPIIAKIVSTAIAATVAFLGNRFWTWRHRERTNLRREYALYFGFNAVGLAIGLACLWISHYWLGSIWPSVFDTPLADNISANIIGIGLASLFRFWAYRRYVFQESVVIV